MRTQPHFHPVARPDPDEIDLRRSRRMREDYVLVLQLHPAGGVGHQFHHSRLQHRALLLAGHSYGRVKTQGPLAVTATQCSKCAEYDPSLVTAVQRSFSTCISGRPWFTMGSIASTMPSFNRGFSPRRSMKFGTCGSSCNLVPMPCPTISRTTVKPLSSTCFCTVPQTSNSRFPGRILSMASSRDSSVTLSSRFAESLTSPIGSV